jgi:hypothetical protein
MAPASSRRTQIAEKQGAHPSGLPGPQASGGAVARSGDHMKEKIEVLLKTLGNAFTGASVEHKHAEGRHQIHLTLPNATHRVDFLDEVIASKDASHLKRLCKQVAAHLQHGSDGKPKHVLVKSDGIHEGF